MKTDGGRLIAAHTVAMGRSGEMAVSGCGRVGAVVGRVLAAVHSSGRVVGSEAEETDGR